MSDGVRESIYRVVGGPENLPPSAMNQELSDLMNPSITARPLHIPESGRIKTFKNKEYAYFLAFDRCGSSPNHERVEALRGQGWQNATTDDVEMYSKDNVKSPNEIRSGDRLLMKIPMLRWREIRKDQNLKALNQINPVRSNAGPMGLGTMTPGLQHQFVDDASVRAGAVVSDARRKSPKLQKGGRKLAATHQWRTFILRIKREKEQAKWQILRMQSSR